MTGVTARLWSAAMAEKDKADESGRAPPCGAEPAAKKTGPAGEAGKPKAGNAGTPSDREARLGEALRANLRRRKAAQKKETD